MAKTEKLETRPEVLAKAKLHGLPAGAKSRILPNVDMFADRLSGDPRLGLMMAGRSASNFRRAPLFRSSRVT